MKHLLTLLLLLVPATVPAAETPPNIVLVLSDDHSVPHLGCYGDTTVKTPHLDRFAAEGMRFDRAFTGAPQCVPSRATMLSGRSPVAARITRFSSPLPRDVETIPDVLRPLGYYTGICRRWFHLDGPGRPGPITEPIFEEHQMRTFDDRVDYLDKNSRRDQTSEKVGEFLDQVPEGKPFFLWVSFNDPHHKWDQNAIPTPYDPATVEVPGELPDLPGMRQDLALYYGEVARMDEEFQMVLDEVEQRGHRENTIVIFMGDNGYAFPHGKGSLYDPGLNVPLLIRWPGVVPPGGESSVLISGEDLAPTLIHAAGGDVPSGMTGHDFGPLLRGEAFEPREYIFAERGPHGQATFAPGTRSSGFDLSRCVRSERYKLIYNCTPYMEYSPVDSAGDPGWRQIVAAHEAGTLSPEHEAAYFTHPRPIYELFDLQADPDELHNRADDPAFAEIKRQLQIALQEKMIVDYDFLPLPTSE